MAVGTTAPGQLIGGRYRLAHEIGRGGMAAVYRAHDQQLDRDVALKLVDSGPASEDFSDTFLKEARAAASLRDPNVVTVFDVGEHDGRPFFVMELLEGGDLRALLRARGRLGPREAGRIALGVARALAAVHARGLIHCDVKPHNVLLTRDGQPKLVDFGISEAWASGAAEQAMIIGSAPYLSPEQVRGEPVDPRSDVYALGLLLYELLAGRPAFTGSSPGEVAAMRLRAPPRPIRELVPEVPPALADALERALAPDPEGRFPDAGAMATALAAALSNEPARRRQDTPAGRLAGDLHGATTRVVALPARRVGRWDRVRRLGGRVPAGVTGGRSAWLAIGLAAVLLLGLAAIALTTVRGAAAERVAAPGVAGMRYEDAVQQLEAAGLRPVKSDEPITLDTPRGVVVTQEPLGGQFAKKGEPVRLVVSSGIAVPNFVGQRWDDVKPWMDQNGWTVGRVRFVVADQSDFGKVVAQQPGADAGPVADKQSAPIDINVAGPPEATRTGFPSGPAPPAEATRTGLPSGPAQQGPAQQLAPPPPRPAPGRGEQQKPEAKPEKKRQGG